MPKPLKTNTMKNYFTLFFFSLLFSFSLTLNAQNYFDKTFDFGSIDHPQAIVTDASQNAYICGWFEDATYQNPRAFVIKTDDKGQEMWRVSLDVPSKFYALCVTHEGNVALAGSRNGNCFLISLDGQTGTELWKYEEQNSDDYWFGTVNEVMDNGTYNLYVIKTKDASHPIWYYLFNPSNGNYVKDDKNTQNPVFGRTYTSGLITPELVWSAGTYETSGLVVADNFGVGESPLWSFSAPHIAGVQKYSDGKGSVLISSSSPWQNTYFQILIMDVINGHVYGEYFDNNNNNSDVTGSGMLDNNKFLITGTIDNELALWFIDYDMTTLEDKIIATANPRTGIDVVGLPSTDIYLMGTEETGNADATDVFLMKLDQNGALSVPENNKDIALSVYPNPAANQLNIKSNGQSLRHAKAYIVNSMGQTVKTVVNLNRPIDLSNLTKGLYVVMVYDNNKLLSQQKFIKK